MPKQAKPVQKRKPTARRIPAKDNSDLALAATKRAYVAMLHLDVALAELDSTRSDLSSVCGENVGQVINQIDGARALLKLAYHTVSGHATEDAEGSDWLLDHTPSRAELHVGHGAKHGCGKVER